MPVAAPPDVPPGLDARTTAYLRRLSVWAYGELQKEMPKNEASPAVLLQSPNGSVYRITVDDSGKLVSTPISLGSGEAGSPVITFAPITLSSMKQVATPAGTASATYVMMGLGLTVLTEEAVDPELAPEVATRAWVTINGKIANSQNGGETDIVLCYGTGTPPANGAAQAGTVITQAASFIATSGGNSFSPFSLTSIVTGLIPGTSYWFDLAMKVTAGTGTVTNVDACAMGLP